MPHSLSTETALLDRGEDRRLSAVLDAAAARLALAGVPSPRADAELLVAHVTGRSRGEIAVMALLDQQLTPVEHEEFERLLARRAAREPLQHLTGRAPFRTIELAVGPGVFVPRPESELTAQFAIDAIALVPTPTPLAVDLCAGSGAIGLAIAAELGHVEVVGVEREAAAFVWAKENQRRLGLSNARIVCADLASALPEFDGLVDVLVSNPPYIPDAAVPRDAEVARFDPPQALFGGPDGLDVVRALSIRALALLRSGGTLVVEHGELQGAELRALLAADGWRPVATHPDLLGRARVTTAARP